MCFFFNSLLPNPLVLSIELLGLLSLHVCGVTPTVTVEGVRFGSVECEQLKLSLLLAVEIFGLLKHEPY